MEEKEGNAKIRIGNELGIGMLGVALLFDALQGVITFIPIPGLIIINVFITFIAYISFGVWFAVHGVNYFSGRRSALKLLAVFGTLVIEIIPFLDLLPAIFGGVATILVATRIEDTIGKEKDLLSIKKKREEALAAATDAQAKARVMATQTVQNRNMLRGAAEGVAYQDPTSEDIEAELQNPRENEQEARMERIRRAKDELLPYTNAWRKGRVTEIAGEADAATRAALRKREQEAQIQKREARLAAAKRALEGNDDV